MVCRRHVSPASRKRYHHGDLPNALVRAAIRIIQKDGVDVVSMRALAREAGVSSGAPFRHFPDRPALLSAVAAQAAADLRRSLAVASAECTDALTSFRALTVAYVRFAVENPALFDLIHDPTTAPPEQGTFLGNQRDERRLQMLELITAGQNAGLIPDADPELVVLTNEALAHGLARMFVDGHPRLRTLTSEDARALALAATQLLQAGVGLS